MIATEDLRNVLIQSVNARDPELLDEVDHPDLSTLEETIQELNERWPRLMMTRGDIEDRPVAVVWLPDQTERYQQVGYVELAQDENGAHTDLIEGVDPALIAEDPPGLTVAEWESALEIDHGEGRWT